MCWWHMEFPPMKNALHFPCFAIKSSSDLYCHKSKQDKLPFAFTYLHTLHQRPATSSTLPSGLMSLTCTQLEKIVSKSFVSPLFVCFTSGTVVWCSSNKLSFASIQSSKIASYCASLYLIISLALTDTLMFLVLNLLDVRFLISILHFLNWRGAAVVLSSLLALPLWALWNIFIIFQLSVAWAGPSFPQLSFWGCPALWCMRLCIYPFLFLAFQLTPLCSVSQSEVLGGFYNPNTTPKDKERVVVCLCSTGQELH